jgi:hypothetical protein
VDQTLGDAEAFIEVILQKRERRGDGDAVIEMNRR